jgi:hypothetical protein
MNGLLTRLGIYFFGGTLQRVSSIVGVTFTAIGVYGLSHYSKYLFVRPDVRLSDASIAFSALLWLVPVIGIIALFLGTGLMPIILVQLSGSRQLKVLPHGRWRLLLSAVVTVTLIATVFAFIVKELYEGYPVDIGEVFSKAFVVSLLTFSFLYALLWLVSQARSAVMLLSGTMLIIPCLALPFRYVQLPASSIRGPAVLGSIMLLLSAALYLAWPRSGVALLGRIGGSIWKTGVLLPRYRPGNEQGLILKLPHPGWLAVGQALPIAVASMYISNLSMWLFYFALCSVICGALASLAAGRSRLLWLLTPCTRQQLYRHVEALYWRQNACCVGMLVIMLLALGSLLGLSTRLLMLGIPLLLAGVAAGTYLGLMITAPLRILEAALAIGIMLVMLGIGYFAERADLSTLYAGIGMLGISAMICRRISRRRWQVIDWALNRPARQS